MSPVPRSGRSRRDRARRTRSRSAYRCPSPYCTPTMPSYGTRAEPGGCVYLAGPPPQVDPDEFEQLAGLGARARTNDSELLLGRTSLFAERGVECQLRLRRKRQRSPRPAAASSRWPSTAKSPDSLCLRTQSSYLPP
jgi:hypothetical protein